MATDFDIADLLDNLKSLYGDRFKSNPKMIYIWLNALKYAEPINLQKAVQHWAENNPKTPTLSDIKYTVRKFEPARASAETQDNREREAKYNNQLFNEGKRKVWLAQNTSTWMHKDYVCYYKGEVRPKLDVILEYFGHDDWMTVLRNQVGIKPSDGLTGINRILYDSTTLNKYKEAVDFHLGMIEGVQTA